MAKEGSEKANRAVGQERQKRWTGRRNNKEKQMKWWIVSGLVLLLWYNVQCRGVTAHAAKTYLFRSEQASMTHQSFAYPIILPFKELLSCLQLKVLSGVLRGRGTLVCCRLSAARGRWWVSPSAATAARNSDAPQFTPSSHNAFSKGLR